MTICLTTQPSPELIAQARMFSEANAERIDAFSKVLFQSASRFMEQVGQVHLAPEVAKVLNDSIAANDSWRYEHTLRNNPLLASANKVARAAYWELHDGFSFLRESVGVQYRRMSYASREQYLVFVNDSIAAFEFLMARINDDPSTVFA